MKSIIEGERALGFWLAQQTEVSLHHKDNKIKEEASDLVSLMTPVVKSLFTDMGMEITSDAMQIFGGYGYTKDQGIEQLYRDNRITPIYEGTNSIQSIDLVFRKLVNKDRSVIDRYIKSIEEEILRNPDEKDKVLDHYKNPQALAALKAPIFEEKVINHIISNMIKTVEKKVSKKELFKK